MSSAKPTPMDIALEEARLSERRGEVPIGAVIVCAGELIARGGNANRELHDATAHAEVNVIRQASLRLDDERLADCDLYVTLEPCTMCAAAISFARIRRLYFGVEDVKGGAVNNGVRFFEQATCHHAPEVYCGIAEQEAAALLKVFFEKMR